MIYYSTNSIFEKDGHDEKIDFIKGWCILCVILNHCVEHMQEILFPLWGSPAVALFILIQVFHSFKKEGRENRINWRHIWNRVIRPFLIIQLFLIPFWLLFYDMPILEQIKLIIYKGGKGPGSYYIWVYVQIAILIYIFTPLLKSNNHYWKAFIFIIISEAYEILFCFLGLPNYIYVLLSFRYLFLIYLGFRLATKEYVINSKTLFTAMASIVCLLLFSYSSISWYPFFYNHSHFTTCHWPCYFFITYLLLYVLILIYNRLIVIKHKIVDFLCYLGKESYTIFLSQMAFFSVMDIYPLRPWCNNILNLHIGELVYIILSLSICISPVYFRRLIK